MLLLLMLGIVVRPVLGMAGELHQAQHALATGCSTHIHTHMGSHHQHDSSQSGCHFMDEDGLTPAADDPPEADKAEADGRHAALLHQADVGFVAALPSLPYVPDTFILALMPPSGTWTGVLPQPASSPFRPPILPSTPACA